MALSLAATSSSSTTNLSYVSFRFKNPKVCPPVALLSLTSPSYDSPRGSLRISADAAPKVRFIARRKESVSVRQLQRPLSKTCFIVFFSVDYSYSSVCSLMSGLLSFNLFWVCFVLLVEYMSLPASQYSVLDAERIERVDDNTFRCYVYRFKFFAFEVCPVLLVRVDEQPDGCSINLLSCKVLALLYITWLSIIISLLVSSFLLFHTF